MVPEVSIYPLRLPGAPDAQRWATHYNGESHDTSRTQWRKWSLLSKLTAIGAYVSILSLFLSVISVVLPREPHKPPNLPLYPSPHDQTIDQTLRQLTDRHGSFDQQVAPLGKGVKLLSSNEKPIYAQVDLRDAEYWLLLKVNDKEEVASWKSADFLYELWFSIRAVPIDVPYKLSVVIDKQNVTYAVSVNTEYAKNALRTVFAKNLSATR